MSSGGHNLTVDTNAITENTSHEQYEQLKQTIVQACISNSISTVIDIVSHNKELCTEQLSWYDSSSGEGDEMMYTPLIFICIDYQHVDLIENLLQVSHSPDMLNTLVGGDGEYTALQWASYMGNLQIVKLLVEKGGANPDDKEALSLAEEDDHTDVYEYLLEHVNAYGDFENMYIGSSSDESSYGSTKGEEAVTVSPRIVDKPKDTPTPTIIRSGSLLTFSIPSSDGELSLKLNQSKTKDNNQGSNETNTGFVMWPSAVMLSHHLTQNPDIVLGSSGADADGSELEGSVMELGSGCGLAGLTAATLLENSGSVDKVIFTDYNPSVLENLRKNVKLNEFDVDHKVLGLDWFDQQQQLADEQQIMDNDEEDEETTTTAKDSDENSNTWVDMDGIHHDQARLIIGSDLIVCSNDAELVAATLDCALLEGGQAIIIGADSCTRFGVKDFPNECRLLGLDVEVNENVWQSTADHDDGDEEQLKNELKLGGYDQRAACFGHDFTMFTIHKPISVAV